MEFLHHSFYHSHGYLHSSNCVIDGRFALKITDFHLPMFRKPHVPVAEIKPNDDVDIDYKRLLWRAPGAFLINASY